MALTIGGKPDADFDDPIGLLGDCHRRIERFLAQLIALSNEARGEPLGASQRQALGSALRYFREAAPRHTRDEEDSLFPRMKQVGKEEARAVLAALNALEADHQRADGAHAEVDAIGMRWLESSGCLSSEESGQLAVLLTDLEALYASHIAIEDTQVFPAAQRVLGESDLLAVGQEMADRRGIDRSKLPDLKPQHALSDQNIPAATTK